MQSSLKILYIDDHAGLRDGLAYLLSQKNPDFMIFTADNKDDSISLLTDHPDINTVILDLNLDGTDGIDVLKELRKINPSIITLIYTMYNDPIHIEKSLRANIQGYVTKEIDIDELENAIINVSKGNTYYNKQASTILNSILMNNTTVIPTDKVSKCFMNYKTLTKKEQEIFLLLAQKEETYDIAKKLNKSEKTVINQRSIIFQKLQLRDRLELIETAKLLGVIV